MVSSGCEQRLVVFPSAASAPLMLVAGSTKRFPVTLTFEEKGMESAWKDFICAHVAVFAGSGRPHGFY